jgi:hypothetical protein
MAFHLRCIGMLLGVFSSGSFLVGQTFTPMNKYACNADVPKGYKALTIDGGTLTLADGSTQYSNGDRVLIVVTNMNPFAAKYSLQLKKQPVQELNLGDFLSNLGGIVSGCDVTGEICTKWNERESTWRKSGSCQSRGTSQSRS